MTPPSALLAIETSCDETSAAVLRRDGSRTRLASCVILSQDIHRVFGGVVPELASRAHLTTIGPVVMILSATGEARFSGNVARPKPFTARR